MWENATQKEEFGMSLGALGLGQRLRVVAEGVALGKSFEEMAQEVGVSGKTAREYGRMPMFRAILEELRKEATAKARAKLEEEALRSVEMVTHIRDNAVSDETRLKASFGILDRALPKQTEHKEERVVRLELSTQTVKTLRETLSEIEMVEGEDGLWAEEGLKELEGN